MIDDKTLFEKGIIPERPPSLDEKGRRFTIHPAKVKGFWRKRRTLFYAFLLFVFLVIPWTTFRGKQTILLDLPNRQFTFFDFTFFAHDGPLIFFILGAALFGLTLVTAIFGRLWCGWACPQTVFIDSIYRKIDEWVEGKYVNRRRLDQSPWTMKKLLKKTAKWTLFLIVSSHIAHSFTAYFVGAHELVWITLSPPSENWGLFIFVQSFTLITLFNFGWFREQFCLIACPYGRFQSVLMDENSNAVLYDYKRGEPRKTKGLRDHGDCVNCLRCVNVCPTGIDIRNGLQMECIACTACIDACDEVMEKVGFEKGLIRYSTEAFIEKKAKKTIPKRAYAYAAIFCIMLAGLSVSLAKRGNIEVKILRAVESPYKLEQTASGEIVINHFKVHVTNQSEAAMDLDGFSIEDQRVETVAPTAKQSIPAKSDAWVHVFIKTPIDVMRGQNKKVFIWNLVFSTNDDPQNVRGNLTVLAPSK